MRVLSLLQPWATLWVSGQKLIETRSWSTPYRGRVAVHASKRMHAAQIALCYTPPFAAALSALGLNEPKDLPLGSILGWVDVVGCLRMKTHAAQTAWLGFDEMCIGADCDPRLTAKERAFGDYRAGRFGLVTGRERGILSAPVTWRGAQGLRALPPDVASKIQL